MRNAAAARVCHFTTKSMISLRAAMKFHYYPETDSLYIDLSERVGADAREVARGVALDFDTDGQLVGIDIDNRQQDSRPLAPRGRDPAGEQPVGIPTVTLPAWSISRL